MIDAGVWATAASAVRLAAHALTFDDRIVDGLVWAVARGSWLTALGSRIWDDVVIDGAVEWTARANWWAGKTVRRLQNGMVHDYYIIVAAGVVIAVVVAASCLMNALQPATLHNGGSRMLTAMIAVPLLGALVVAFLPRARTVLIRRVALGLSIVPLVLTLIVWLRYSGGPLPTMIESSRGSPRSAWATRSGWTASPCRWWR